MIRNILTNSRGSASLKLVLGIVIGVLLVGVVSGMLYLSSNSSKGDRVANVKIAPQKEVFYSIESQPQAEPEPKPQEPQPSVAETTRSQPAKTVAVAQPVEQVTEEAEPEKDDWQETDESNAEAEYEREQFEMRVIELQSLKDELPNNSLIPYERTQEEIEEMVAIGEEINAIGESIQDNTASPEERQRYFDAVSKQFDDQIELINYCNEKLADPNGDAPQLCKEVTANSEKQLQQIKGAKETLRKEVMQEKQATPES